MSDFLDSVIPSQPVEATLLNPRALVIYKDMKVGASAISAWLSIHRKAVWLDCEDGSGAEANCGTNVIRKAAELKMTRVDFCLKLFRELAACNPPRHRFLIVDKVDAFEDWADGWAVADYKKTALGNAPKYKNLATMGEVEFCGWKFWAQKFNELWTAARMAAPYVIFICSLRTTGSKQYGEHGVDAAAGFVNSTDLDLGVRQRKIASGDSDAIGLMWRADDGANYLTFRTKERGSAVGNRIPRLEGTTIKLSWLDKDRKLVVDWDSLYKLPPVVKNGEPAPAPATISQSTSTNV